jgi:hypothetical protein
MPALDSLLNALTRKVQMVNKDITREVVEDWVADAGYRVQQIAFMSATLTELENGEYTPEEMAGDILQLACLDN